MSNRSHASAAVTEDNRYDWRPASGPLRRADHNGTGIATDSKTRLRLYRRLWSMMPALTIWSRIKLLRATMTGRRK